MIIEISDGEPEIVSTIREMRCIFTFKFGKDENSTDALVDVIIYYENRNEESYLTDIKVEDSTCPIDMITESIQEQLKGDYILTNEDSEKIGKIIADFINDNSIIED